MKLLENSIIQTSKHPIHPALLYTSTTMSLTNKVAIVTGSSAGIGASIAHTLATRGASVVINYASSTSAALAVLSSLPRPSGQEHTTIQADVSSLPDCQRLISSTVEKYGRLDFLILNAGWMPAADISNTTEEVFDRCYNTNVKGPWFLTQYAAPHLPEDGSARVIFFGTSLTGANTLTPNYTLYVSTKGAVEQMVRGISKDLGRRNIVVNMVSPGPTRTDLFLKGKTEQLVKFFETVSPRNRIGEPEDVAGVVGFLCEKEAGWVMGQNLRVNGGFV
jgi:3-oxoacyl-[acyl-carrier protein] reductase